MTRIVTDTPPGHFRVLAKCCEPLWLQKFLGWRITAPANCNRSDWHPLSGEPA